MLNRGAVLISITFSRLRHQATGMPNGLRAVGYTPDDIPDLVRGALPQKRVLGNAPRDIAAEDLARMYADAMQYW